MNQDLHMQMYVIMTIEKRMGFLKICYNKIIHTSCFYKNNFVKTRSNFAKKEYYIGTTRGSTK